MPSRPDGTDTAAEWVTVTEPDTRGDAISRSVSAYKVKGAQRVDLTWSGATSTSVDIYRNGSVVATTADDGAHTDVTGEKGGGVSYTYKVCKAGTSTCSNDAVTSF